MKILISILKIIIIIFFLISCDTADQYLGINNSLLSDSSDEDGSSSGSRDGSSVTYISPDDITGLVFWLDADDDSTITGGTNVSNWADKSAGGHDASQSTAANQPAYITAGMNNRNVVQFDGNNDILTIPANDDMGLSSTTYQRTLVIAFRTETDITSRQALFEEGGSGNGLNIYIRASNLYINVWSSSITGTIVNASYSISQNTSYMIIFTYEDTGGFTINGYLNRNNFNNTGTGDFTLHTDNNGVGAVNGSTRFDNGTASGSNYYDGYIAEILMYDNVISSSDISDLEDYLSNKWGI